MTKVRALLATMLGTVLVFALMAPTSQASKQQVWVSGSGVADYAGECEGADPDAGVFSNMFTSDAGPDVGLNGCWYFDFGSLETAIAGDEVVDLPGDFYQVLWYPEERFVGTLDGQPVEFETEGAVVGNLFRGDASQGTSGEIISGGCHHPIHPRDGKGSLAFVEEVGTPNLTYQGWIYLR